MTFTNQSKKSSNIPLLASKQAWPQPPKFASLTSLSIPAPTLPRSSYLLLWVVGRQDFNILAFGTLVQTKQFLILENQAIIPPSSYHKTHEQGSTLPCFVARAPAGCTRMKGLGFYLKYLCRMVQIVLNDISTS